MDNHEHDSFKSDEPTLNLDSVMLRKLASSRLHRNCVSSRRLTSGHNNEIHLLQFDNGPDCIARLPFDPIQPAAKLDSEVATMKYIAQNTSIKVPEVYDWNCSTHNVIKTPYILMERLPGQPLNWVWDELTIENKKSILSQIVKILFEIWTKCQFKEIGCLYMNKDSLDPIQERVSPIGPIVNPIFYSNGRDIIPSFTGPFKSSREWFDTLIQKEKSFFENGDEKLIIRNRRDAVKLPKLLERLGLLQYKLSENNPFELIDLPPSTLIHGDFDEQNILVEHSPVDNDIKIVGIIDWELSCTGTLYDLCEYPCWIQDEEFDPCEVPSDKMLQENQENQDLRAYFRDEMIALFGDIGGQLLDMKEQDKRIDDLKFMFLFNHPCSFLEKALECSSYFSH